MLLLLRLHMILVVVHKLGRHLQDAFGDGLRFVLELFFALFRSSCRTCPFSSSSSSNILIQCGVSLMLLLVLQALRRATTCPNTLPSTHDHGHQALAVRLISSHSTNSSNLWLELREEIILIEVHHFLDQLSFLHIAIIRVLVVLRRLLPVMRLLLLEALLRLFLLQRGGTTTTSGPNHLPLVVSASVN